MKANRNYIEAIRGILLVEAKDQKEYRGSVRAELQLMILQSLMSGGKLQLNFDRLDKTKAAQIMDSVGNGREFEDMPTFTEFLEAIYKEFPYKEFKNEAPAVIEALEFAQNFLLAQISVYAKFSKYLVMAEIKTAGIKECFEYLKTPLINERY